MAEDHLIVLAHLLRSRGRASNSRAAVVAASLVMAAAERFAQDRHRALRTATA